VSENLGVRGARGGGVTIIGQLARIILQFVGVLVLSRLLPPADFGLIAMLTVFVALGELLRDFGMPTAALQARKLSRQQASNLFWLNTALGATAGAALLLASPLIVALYDEPRLADVIPFMAAMMLLNGVQAQLQVQLARAFRFVALAATAVVAPLIALVVAVAGALAGWAYWALVAQLMANTLVLLLTRGILARWRPARPRHLRETGALIRSGGNLGLAQVLTFAASNADTMVIGARLGATDLGYYNRSFQLLTLPITSMLAPLTQVVLPTVNRALDLGQRLGDLLLRLQFAMGSAIVLAYTVAVSTASWLIPELLGAPWSPAAPVFQILAIGGCFQVFSHVSYWAFLLGDQSRQLLHYNLVTKPMIVVLVLLGSQFGLIGVACAYSLGLALSWPINLAWLARTMNQESWAFFRSGMRFVAAGAAGYAASYVIVWHVLSLSGWAAIWSSAAISTGVYVTFVVAIPGGFTRSREAFDTAIRAFRFRP
jgi:PST family polysaccharide transporter